MVGWLDGFHPPIGHGSSPGAFRALQAAAAQRGVGVVPHPPCEGRGGAGTVQQLSVLPGKGGEVDEFQRTGKMLG